MHVIFQYLCEFETKLENNLGSESRVNIGSMYQRRWKSHVTVPLKEGKLLSGPLLSENFQPMATDNQNTVDNIKNNKNIIFKHLQYNKMKQSWTNRTEEFDS